MNTPIGGDASASKQRKKLPVNPSLEHLQKQAKRRVKQNPALQLAAAQHQIAQEYGCKNWAELGRTVVSMSHRHDSAADAPQEFGLLPKAARTVEIGTIREILTGGDFTQHDLNQALAHSLWYQEKGSWQDRKAIADLLIEQGADPDAQYGSGGYGPIVFGTGECLNPAGLQYLIDAGADVTFPPVETKYGEQCPLSYWLGTYARGQNDRKHEGIEILLKHGAYVPPEVTPPILAIHRGDAAGLAELLDADSTLISQRFANMPYGNMQLRGATLLHCAVEFDEIECAEELFKRHAEINEKADVIEGVGGQTPVFHAIDTNSATLEYLVKRVGQWMDMSLRATWKDGAGTTQAVPMTPLEYGEKTARAGDPQWEKKLTLLRTLDHQEQIKAAILREDEKAVGRLLDERPDLLTPALWPTAIFRAGSPLITRLLLARGLSPDECSAPRKPLHFAVDLGRPDILRELLAAGADPNVKDGEGFAPLDLYGGLAQNTDAEVKREIVTLLRHAGAEMNLWTAMRIGDTELALDQLSANTSLTHTISPDLGFLPLHVAARMADARIVAWLLEHGADVNAGENTALWFACQSGAPAENRLEVAKLLLDAGADINRRCEDGTTALHFAAWRGPAEVVEFLLSHGARNWITDDKGKLPCDYAKESAVSPDKDAIAELFSHPRIKDPVFREAVDAMTAGDLDTIKRLLKEQPSLATAQAEENGEYAGPYFSRPHLLEFVAENPIRTRKLPPNICEIAQAIIDAGSPPESLTKTLALAASGCVPRECGVQTGLLKLLVKNGADPVEGLNGAINEGEKEAVQTMLRLGAKPGLLAAAGLGDAALVGDLLAGGTFSLREKEHALHAALRYNHIETAELLWKSGVELHREMLDYGTPLHYAALFGQKSLCQWLIEQGADPTVTDSQWQGTPAGWAHHNGHPELAAWLREGEGSSTKEIDQKIVGAVCSGDLPTLCNLLDAHPEKLALTGGPWNKPLLHNAAWEGHLEIVRELVKRGADVNARCESDHACPIHFAAERGHLEIVRFLAEAGSEIEAGHNDHQLNVLGWATSLGSYHEDVAQFLLSRGAKMSIWSAIALNDTEATRSLITADPDLVRAQMSRNEYFRSPLHHAVARNRPAVVRLLLELGADPNAGDAMGLSVLGSGNADTDPEILTLLEARMDSPNLHDALTLGRFDQAAALLAEDSDCIKPGGSETRLFVYAVCRKNWSAAEWLLDHGADINAIAEVYQCPATALHFAIESAPVERIRWLLDRGPDTTIPDGMHHADALGWAEFFGKSDIAEMIKERRKM